MQPTKKPGTGNSLYSGISRAERAIQQQQRYINRKTLPFIS